MKPQLVLLKLGELILKGRNRHRFERRILGQVKAVLSSFEGITYRQEFGRILLELGDVPYESVRPQLRQVFGLSAFAPVYTADLTVEAVQEAALTAMRSLPAGPRSFKVTVRRVNKSFPHDSQEMNRLVSGPLLRSLPDLRVDVHNPDTELKIELREQQALLYCQLEQAAGGFPLGSNGRAMLMLSGGIDSPAAGYLAMRQGLELQAVHFHSFPYTSERSQEKVQELASRLAGYSGGELTLHMVPFTSVQTRIHNTYRDNLLITILRRTMMRITEKLAAVHGGAAIVTGESLGQVASQTLPSMNAIGRAVRIPLIRPLITMEKQEIITLAEQIGTYATSILPYEDCCTIFLPPSPSTNPNLNVIERVERSMPWLEEEIQAAVEGTVTLRMGLKGRLDTVDELEALF